MSKKIRITESQLKMLQEQLDSEKGDDFSSLQQSVSNHMSQDEDSFNSPEELLSSITDRLANAITTQDWALVHEVFNDIRDFVSNKVSKEDLPSIDDQSSVESDTPDEYDERHYGISESVEKIKSNFRRFL